MLTIKNTAGIVWLILIALFMLVFSALASGEEGAKWVSEQQCGSCHPRQFDHWLASDHAKAMGEPVAENIRGAFNNEAFYHKNQRYWFHSTTVSGGSKAYAVAYTFGWEPLQQYLVETEEGRFQAFPQAWDTNREKWFHLYPEQAGEFGQALHWLQPPHNANTQCISCHVSNFKANYVAATDRFNSSWEALGVGCQSCHGAASLHLNWAQSENNRGYPATSDKGFKISLNQSAAQLNSCGQCHSRRIELADFSAELDFHQQFLLSPLSADLYEVDGKILDEVFEYGSFVQSKMYQAGVQCSDCHNAHSGKLKLPGNAVCSQCHNSQQQVVRAEVLAQGLPSKNYDSEQHHFHAEGSTAALCVSCHMPARTYMGNDERHDHSFSSPNPTQAVALQHSDPCLSCHIDQTEEKTIEQFKQWFPNAQARDHGYARTMFMARHGHYGAVEALLEQLQQEKQPPIRLAALLTELIHYPSQAAQQMVVQYLEHPHVLLRRAAIEVAAKLMPVAWLQRQLPAWLQDKSTAVRVTAAEQLIGLQLAVEPKLLAEYERLQQRHLATAEANYNLASVYQLTGRQAEFPDRLRFALKQNEHYLPAIIAWSEWLEKFSPTNAHIFLQEQLQRQPESAVLQYAMALSQIRQGNLLLGIQYLQQASDLAPLNSQYKYVLAVAKYESGAQQEALAILRSALASNPHHRHLRLALLQYSRHSEEQQQLLHSLQLINPFDPLLETYQRE